MLLGGLRLCSHFLRGRKIAYPSKLGIEVQLLCVNEDWWGILLSGGLGIIPNKVWMTNKAKSPRSSQNLFILFLFIYFFLRVFIYLLIYLFIFHLFLLAGGQSLHSIAVGFVIHWHESAMELHVFPIPIPPPTCLSTRSLWVFPVH